MVLVLLLIALNVHVYMHTHKNIDSLERRAGLNPDLLVEAHGGFSTAHCIDCGQEYTEDFVKGQERWHSHCLTMYMPRSHRGLYMQNSIV